MHFHALEKVHELEAKCFLRKIKKDLVMACHIRIIPPLEKAKKQGEMPLTRLSPIPSLNSTFCNGMGLSLVNGISLFREVE